MKKYLISLIALALLVTGVNAFAGTTEQPILSNPYYADGFGTQNTPPTVIRKVRYGRAGLSTASLGSGDVVCWDTNSADGVTVSACVAVFPYGSPAGVLVTALSTQDIGSLDDVINNDDYGYMAVSGYCLAAVDTSVADTGGSLCVSSVENAMFGTNTKVAVSQDCGTLLSDTGSDADMQVMLKLQ